ncbi:MAG: hypothetical protein Q8M44_01405 [bacterium]|nr:hypothetical protein [bacterium]
MFCKYILHLKSRSVFKVISPFIYIVGVKFGCVSITKSFSFVLHCILMFHVTFELGQFNNFQYALIHDILFIALLFLKSQLTLIELK